MPGNDPFQGQASQIAYGVESTSGTAVTPTEPFNKIADDTDHPDPEQNWYEERYIGGDGRELDDLSTGQIAYEGGTYPFQIVNAVPLVWALGSESYDDTTNTHTITAAGASSDATPPTLTVEAVLYGRGGANDFVRTFEGVAADAATISTDNDNRLTCEVDAIAAGVQTGTSPTSVGSLTEAEPWLWSDISSDISINGTTFARLTEWAFTVENNVSPQYYITSDVTNKGDPFETLYGNVNYDFSATTVADDDTLYQEVLGQDDANVDITLQFTRGNGDTLDFTISGVGLQESAYPMSRGDDADDERVEVETTGTPTGVTIELQDSVRQSAVLA
jgi:hypothetical protein